jgi:hypothetical protein
MTLVFTAAYAFLGARFLVEYFAAPSIPFVQWIREMTDHVYRPLGVFFATGHDRAGHPIAWALLVAIAAVAVLQIFVVRWLRRVARPRASDDFDDDLS